MTDLSSLIETAVSMLPRAYAPYSNYSVACSLVSMEGAIFSGVNLENAAYSLCICAETAAIAQMVASGQQRIRDLIVLAGDQKLCTPCGACRQRIVEFSCADTRIHFCDHRKVIETCDVDSLLPNAFHFS